MLNAVKVACAAVTAAVAFYIAVTNFDYMKSVNQHEIRGMHGFNWTSSVKCHMSNGTQLCSFKNVCYLPENNQFLFTLSEHSVLLGLTSKEDLKSIKLSSVRNHNLMSMNIAIVINESIIPESGTVINEPLFLLWRFKWDNIMHVFHDDLIPLFLTFLNICENINVCVSKYTLGFVDQGKAGPYYELYSIFSHEQPLFLHQHNKSMCFREIQTGILSKSTWFQYGFGQKQGPLNTSIPSGILHQFKEYVFQRYGIFNKYLNTNLNNNNNNNNNNTVVFFNRKLNRRILNLEYFTSVLFNTLQETYPSSQPTIIELDLVSHNISRILDVLLTSKIVVGLHGSAMILCLFLHPGSVVVELFPFGIQPEHVSFIKSFSNIVGTGIVYRSWVNRNETLSLAHPEAPPLLGGIHHLPKAIQELIWNTKTVPAVECCHDPMYLYRMFQDTIVGSDFKSAFQEALVEQQAFSKETLRTTYMNNLISSWYFPAHVTKISCSLHQHILIASWQPPINGVGTLIYDIAVLLDNSTFTKRTPVSMLKIDLNRTVQSAEIWIKALSFHSESLDSYSQCISNT